MALFGQELGAREPLWKAWLGAEVSRVSELTRSFPDPRNVFRTPDRG